MPIDDLPEDEDEDVYEETARLDLMLLRAGPARIVRQSLSEQAARAIKSRIFSLELPPGSRLVVDDLARALGVSRTPVREALRSLAADGLVTYDGNTYMVTAYTRRDVEDLFAIRRALEMLAASQAAQRMSRQAIEEERALLEQSKDRIVAGDTEYLISQDVHFHQAIAQGSENPRLQALLANLQEQAWLIRRWGFLRRLVEFVEMVTLEEHLAILDRLAAGDSVGASQLMGEHLLKGEQRTLEWLGL